MNEQDIASERRNRLKALRAEQTANEDGIEQEGVVGTTGRRRAWRDPAGGARGLRGAAAGGDFRSRILSSLKAVNEGDQLIAGTEIGQNNLEKLMDLLDRAEPSGWGKKLADRVWDILDPVETDSGLDFDPERVAKLVAFLEQGSGPGLKFGALARRTKNSPRPGSRRKPL